MPFFRPERALARLLRHDPFSSFSPSHFHSPLSLTRFFDHHTPFAAPLYTIFEEPRDNQHHHQHNNSQHQPQANDKKEASSSSSSNNQVARSEREDGMERRHRRHRGRHHLSPFSHNSLFNSPFPSLFNSLHPFTPFAPSSIPSMPDMTLDMYSTPTSYTVHAAVPGLDKKDIKITVDDGVLTIEAEKRESKPSSSSMPSSSTTSSPSTASTTTPSQATVETKAEGATQAEPSTTTTDAPSAQSSQPTTTPAATSSSSPTAPAESTEADDGLSIHHVESFYGRVERSVQLPDDAKVDELTAKYEDGVIKIEIPRLQEQKTQAKRIEIQ